MPRGELRQKRVLARHIARHRAMRPSRHFVHILARPQPVAPGIRAHHVILALDQRLRQIDRIGDDADVSQMIVVTDEVLRERDEVAGGNAVAPVPTLFDMGRGDRENVALPLTG